MNSHTLVLSLLLALSACRAGQPCPSCDEDGEADDEDLPDVAQDIPDLPCGGADLQNDDLNCGTCGNRCPKQGHGAYETGGCVDGACGPTWWGTAWTEPTPLTCAEICEMRTGGEYSCMAQACIGLTGFVCESIFMNPCGVIAGDSTLTLVDFEGTCDEPIPWPEETDFGGDRVVYCCCG